MERAIETYVPSNNAALSNALLGLEGQFHQAAVANLEAALAQGGDDYTEMEKRAIVAFEEMKLINGMDLAAVILRGKRLHQIMEEALYSVHPNTASIVNATNTLSVIAKEVGCSISELSNTRDLVDVIFPYMEENLGMNVPTVWEQIGKSNFRELASILKVLITGEPSDRQSLNDAVTQITNDVVATARATGQDLTDEDVRRQAVANLLENGSQMTNTQLRQTIRPTRTPAIEGTVIRYSGANYVVAQVDEDQLEMLRNKMGARMATPVIDLPADPRARVREAARVPVAREIAALLQGE